MDCWTEISHLKGKTLRTLDNYQEFPSQLNRFGFVTRLDKYK